MPPEHVHSNPSPPLAPTATVAGTQLEASRARRRMYWQRNQRLRELGFNTYAEYLASGRWAAAKARYRASEEPQECMCGETDVQIHHKTYERVGEELPADLRALCRRCHVMMHVLERGGQNGLDPDGLNDPERAIEGRARLNEQRAASDADKAEHRQERAAALLLLQRLTIDQRIILLRQAGRVQHVDTSGWIKALKQMRKRGRLEALEVQLFRYERRIHKLGDNE